MTKPILYAPGHPGISPSWTSSAKSGVGTAASSQSRVWFTISQGIVNEVYYPRIDQANTRDLGFLVTDGSSFFSEEKRDTKQHILPLAQGVPGYRLTNTCKKERYRVVKTVVTDPHLNVLLQQIHFEPLRGQLTDYGLYALLAPHINNRGYGNNGWVSDYKGMPMLFAQRDSTALALASSTPFSAMSCGYVGFSDGWQDINAHKRITWSYSKAPDGNIALTGEIDLSACNGSFILVLAFGRNAAEAGQQARAALMKDFNHVVNDYISGWEELQAQCLDLGRVGETGFDLYRVSTAVLKTHEAKHFIGGMIASLSIPWGFAKGNCDLGGYHLVWPRDLVESAGGLLAAGDTESARQTLLYLMSTQEADGHWPQNMWLNGIPYWGGVQMDETAFPILLADALRRINELKGLNPWSMVRQAASFLVCNGPVTQQDRWEEDGGYSPFTLAVEIAALLAAADFADEVGKKQVADYLRQTADTWNENIERWTYVTNTDLARKAGVEGYYVRIAPPEVAEAASPLQGFVPIKNAPPSQISAPVSYIVSPDALALVRFGLRSASDSRIINTIKVIDAFLKTETATGPVWHRYNHDSYGEHEDGDPFDGTGIGRGWPLLTGERAHYELALGNQAEAKRLLHIIEKQTSPAGLIPEQIWDAPDIPNKGLINGQPSGSTMPLVWAHAEYIKLLRSLSDGKVFDMPPQPVKRYQVDKITSPFAFWRFNHKCSKIPNGKLLRVEVLNPATIRWS
ncbi:MAG: glucan 1,4-alpha-glucosidase, partial [Candidatus Wukongarchaeota archaeon]|nr:glucan 1,4-alpha-glucosidase [Candidatus Wukongarchaeota archaeon]